MIFLPNDSYGEAWIFRPSISLEESYHDNVNLSSTSNLSLLESRIRGVIAISRLSETTTSSGRLHANFSDIRENEQYLTFSSEYRGLLSNLKIDGLARRDTTTRSVEQESSDDEGIEDEDIDAGLVQVEKRRTTIEIRPGYIYRFTERFSQGVRYNLRRVYYDGSTIKLGLSDYYQHKISWDNTWKMSELNRISISVSLSKFDPEVRDAQVDSLGFSGSYSSKFSELSEASIILGIQHSYGESGESSFEDTGYLAHINFRRLFENGSARLVLKHDLQPSGFGTLTEINQFQTSLRHVFLPRLSGNIDFRINETQSLGLSNTNKRYFISINPKIIWKISRWWNLGFGYRFNAREIIDSRDDALRHSVILSLNYSKQEALEF